MAGFESLILQTLALVPLAQGRGDDPGGAGGVLLVVGIALGLLLLAAAALFLVSRSFRARRERERAAAPAEQPLPSEQGRPWSSSSER
jgi:hypothetical protein